MPRRRIVAAIETSRCECLFHVACRDRGEGTYAFTHLAKGTYTVRMILPDTLSATPAAQLAHVVTLAAAEDRFGVDCAAVFRPNEIRGVKFDDANGNHQRDAGEPGVGGATILLDLDRDNVFDFAEPTTTSLADGSYAFTGLSPGAYVVREVVPAEYEGTYTGKHSRLPCWGRDGGIRPCPATSAATERCRPKTY